MAVSIDLTLTQVSQNSSTKTSVVGVSVVASWTGGSYNATSPGPTLIIYTDGVLFDSCNVGFNTSQSNSGSTRIYYNEVEVEHNSDGTKTVNMSASYASGVSSGTVYDSASLSLTPFNVSPGGSSGGDSGGSSGGSSGSGSDTVGNPSSIACTFWMNPIGIGSSYLSYELIAVTSNGLVQFDDGDYVYSNTTIRCYFNLPDGYEIIAIYVRNNNDDIETDLDYKRGAEYCEFVMPTYTPTVFPIVGFSGDYYATDMSQSYSYRYNTSDWVDSGNHSYSFFMSENGSVTALRFTTPDFAGRLKNIRFGLGISAANVTGTRDTRYALCSSNANCNNYVGAGASVVDETQIATGVTAITCNKYYRKNVPSTYSELTLDVKLQPNTTYYLYLWDGYAVAAAAKYHNIVFIVEPYYINVDNGTDFVPYEIYIDNGSSWDLYTAYIDNGTNWEIYS